MKNFSTGRLGHLFRNVVIPECFYRESQPYEKTTRFPITTFGNDANGGRLRGFTLIELLVVVLIIGILSAIALPQYQYAVERARLSEAFILAKHLKDAEEIYRMANGVYTNSFEELGVQIPAGYRAGTEGGQPIWRNEYFSISLLQDVDRVLVVMSKNATPYLSSSLYLDSRGGGRNCCSYASSNYEADRLCKSLGGSGAGRAACVTGGSSTCRCFSIP